VLALVVQPADSEQIDVDPGVLLRMNAREPDNPEHADALPALMARHHPHQEPGPARAARAMKADQRDEQLVGGQVTPDDATELQSADERQHQHTTAPWMNGRYGHAVFPHG